MFKENEFLRKLRFKEGIKAKDVALAIGMTPSYVCQVEKGKKPIPRNKILGKWVESLGLSTKYYEQLKTDEIKAKKTYQSELKAILKKGEVFYKGKLNDNEFEILLFKNFLMDLPGIEKYKKKLVDELVYLRFYSYPKLENRFYVTEMRKELKNWIRLSENFISLFEMKKERANDLNTSELETFLLTISYSFRAIFKHLGDFQTDNYSNEYLSELFKDQRLVANVTGKKWTNAIFLWMCKKTFESNQIKHDKEIPDEEYVYTDSYEFEVIGKIFAQESLDSGRLNAKALGERYNTINGKIIELRGHKSVEGQIIDQILRIAEIRATGRFKLSRT